MIDWLPDALHPAGSIQPYSGREQCNNKSKTVSRGSVKEGFLDCHWKRNWIGAEVLFLYMLLLDAYWPLILSCYKRFFNVLRTKYFLSPRNFEHLPLDRFSIYTTFRGVRVKSRSNQRTPLSPFGVLRDLQNSSDWNT